MRSSRLLVLGAAFVLGTAISLVPLEVAGAQAPSTAVLVPSNGADVYGTSVVLDASASSGVTQVQFELTGGSLSDSVIATATLTYYGWIAEWDSTTVPDGPYTLQSVATDGTSSTTSTSISITVTNGTPSVSIVLPSNGANLSGSQWLDAIASPGVTSVEFVAITGTPGACPESAPGDKNFCPIGYATPTQYGWLLDWDTTQVPDTCFILTAGARYPNGNIGIAGLSPSFDVCVVNPPPTIVVPANNSTVSGSQWLDCTIPAGTGAPVQFEYLSNDFPTVIGTATATQYGWLYDWDTTSLANGTYTLLCSATYQSGTGYGDSISVTVAN